MRTWMTILTFLLVTACGVLTSEPGGLRAQGWIYVDPDGMDPLPRPRRIPPPPREWSLHLSQSDVQVRIDGVHAEIEVGATFHNPHPRQLEGVYYFPLPRDAHIEEFRAVLGGKELSGEILPADRARQIYNSLVRRTHDPALLEYYQNGLFRARVFPIPAHGEVHAKIRYRQLLRRSSGFVRFDYPLGTARFGGRQGYELKLEVHLETEDDLASVSSPSHRVSVTRHDARRATVRLAERARVTGKDFVLDYMVASRGLAGGVRAFKEIGEDGYFLLRLAPGTTPPRERPPVTMFFVVDTSGSMATGQKMEHARQSVLSALGRLAPHDRFQILSFAGQVRAFAEAPVPASPAQLASARDFVRGLTARGGTDIDCALRRALAGARNSDDGLVLLVSDGAPTVGVTDPRAIVSAASKASGGDFRIHVFGVGHDVNTRLLDDLARKNGGSRSYLRDGDELELAFSGLLDKVLFPVLTGIRIEADGVTLRGLEPAGPHDLFFGEDLVVAGRYTGSGDGRIQVHGVRGGERLSFVFPATFPRHGGQAEASYLWAQLRVLTLLDRLRGAPAHDHRRIKDEIVDLGLRFGIVTPYTSYLVQEQEQRALGRSVDRSLRRAPRASAAVRDEAAGFGGASGEDAFEYSRRQARRLRGKKAGKLVADLDEAEQELVDALEVHHGGGRAFFQLDGQRVEGSFGGEQLPAADRVLVFGSTDYLEFLASNPRVAPYLASGRRVLFRWQGQVVRVDEGDPGDAPPVPPPVEPAPEPTTRPARRRGEFL